MSIVHEISRALDNEPRKDLIEALIEAIGQERVMAILAEALEKEAAGGVLRRDGVRRTVGGAFFFLAKQKITKKEKRTVFPFDPTARKRAKKKRRPTSEAVADGATQLTWAQAKTLVTEVFRNKGKADVVKITLIGRPSKVTLQKDCVVVALQGEAPKALPKGLPALPDMPPISWAVFITMKQWKRVEDSLKNNKEDRLIIEGYPIVSNNGAAVVYATLCKSVLMERAEREKAAV